MSEDDVMTDQESIDEQKPDDDSAPADGAEPTDEQEPAPDDSVESTDDQEPAPKKKKKLGLKILMIVGIVVVVLAAGGGTAYALLHDTPGFCNFLCHTPMDPYVDSYVSGISINEAQRGADVKLSVVAHRDSDQAITCLGCHTTTLPEQINEGIHWVTGDYEVPLEMKVVSAQIEEVIGGDKDGLAFCLRPECHEGISYVKTADDAADKEQRKVALQQLADATEGEYNPHKSHFGTPGMDCYTCHQTHEQSVLMCTQCHGSAIDLPAGWLSYADWQAQNK
jgi:hypothetical protein